jgi:hypothetical protein
VPNGRGVSTRPTTTPIADILHGWQKSLLSHGD